jgi:predicted ferric reductase
MQKGCQTQKSLYKLTSRKETTKNKCHSSFQTELYDFNPAVIRIALQHMSMQAYTTISSAMTLQMDWYKALDMHVQIHRWSSL